MKKVATGPFISLDGVVEAPDQWHFPYFNDETAPLTRSSARPTPCFSVTRPSPGCDRVATDPHAAVRTAPQDPT